MKQLKFMLAAATAVGIAAAAQADTPAETPMKETKLINNENFDTVVLEDGQFARDMPGYSYSDPANLADDESTISTAAEGYNGTQSLKVNTGTNALLRALEAAGSVATPVPLTAEKSLYIDTMVKFTVTPYGDEVEASKDENGAIKDKLMIYLKECVGSVSEDGATTNFVNKLMVKAAKYKTADFITTFVPTFEESDVEISNAEVVAGTWYNLRVTSYVENGITLFTIKLGDTELASLEPLYTDDAKKIFPALTGNSDTTLTYVGFAGEGMIDNLTVATLEPQTTVDFTFTWTTAGISAVTYTIGNGAVVKDQPVKSGTAIADLDPGATITIAVTPADWYALVDDAVLSYQVPATTGKTQPLDALVEKVTQKTDADGNVTVNPAATPAEIQAAASITTGYFGGANTTASVEEFQAVLNWKSKKGGSKANINNISFVAAGKVGAGDPETDDAKAYLLDCDVDDVETEIKKFTFKGFSLDESGKPVFGVGKAGVEAPTVDNGGEYGNGHVEIRGKASLEANDWVKDCPGASFFRAFLVK